MRFLSALLLVLWLVMPSQIMAVSLSSSGAGPAKASGGGGGVVGSTWDTAYTAITYSNGNLTAACATGCISVGAATYGTQSVTIAGSSAKLYYEITVTYPGSACCMNVGLADSNGGSFTAGFGTYYSIAYDNNGTIHTGGGGSSLTGVSYATGTTIQIAVDFGAKKVWMRPTCSGAWDAAASSDNPNTGTGGISIASSGVFIGSVMRPGYSDYTTGSTNSVTLNVTTGFACTVPTGFSAWG